MTRTELKPLVENQCIDLGGNNVFRIITEEEARAWLTDIFADQESAGLPLEERIPADTTPAAFMEVWNAICVEEIRSRIHCDEVPVESAFIGKSGQIILIQRYGPDDYGALWYNTYGVRGTLKDIMEEVKGEI